MNHKTNRLFFIDHLRGALAILVVLHHVALVYGASLPGYYYVEPPFTNPKAYQWLFIFVMVNQSWFMGAFFLLTGYFTPGSYQRKGGEKFILDKLLRFGIPLIVFALVLSPIAFIGYYLMPSALTGITGGFTWARFWDAYPKFISVGPLWFVLLLLALNLGYLLFRMIFRTTRNQSVSSSTPNIFGILGFIFGLAAVTYGFRMIVPIGKSIWQFPSFAYLPQYLSFFILGIAAHHGDWLRRLPTRSGIFGGVLALLAALFLFPLGFTGKMFSLELPKIIDNAFGNGHWQSAVYALWDSMFAVGLFIALLVLFRVLTNKESSFGSFLGQHSYAVYVFHIPLVVFTGYLLRNLQLNTFIKFGLASLIVLPISFALAYIVRKIPSAKKVL